MKKTIIVSFGHFDVIMPLFRNVIEKIDIELLMCLNKDNPKESVINFANHKLKLGFLPIKLINNLLPKEVKKYLNNKLPSVFIFNSPKLRSFINLFLIVRLYFYLKKYDIIHFNGVHSSLVLLKYLLRKKQLIFTIHDFYPHLGEASNNGLIRYININQLIIQSGHKIIIQNASDYIYLSGKFPFSNINFIPFGRLDIYGYFNNFNFSDYQTDILYFGRLSKYKGLDLLVNAIKKLNEEKLKFQSVIAGSGKIDFDITDLNNLNIKFINKFLSNDELVYLVKSSKIIVCPYIESTQSGVLMLSLFFNKPVIAFNLGVFKEVLKSKFNGILVENIDSDSLAENIKLLLQDEELYNFIVNNLNKFETQYPLYSWKNITNNYLTLLNYKS